MNKIIFGLLAAGAGVALGYLAAKSQNNEPDYDDDIYDYPDPYDEDSVDFEINDSAVEDAAENIADAAEDVADAAADAVEDIADTIKDAADDIIG